MKDVRIVVSCVVAMTLSSTAFSNDLADNYYRDLDGYVVLAHRDWYGRLDPFVDRGARSVLPVDMPTSYGGSQSIPMEERAFWWSPEGNLQAIDDVADLNRDVVLLDGVDISDDRFNRINPDQQTRQRLMMQNNWTSAQAVEYMDAQISMYSREVIGLVSNGYRPNSGHGLTNLPETAVLMSRDPSYPTQNRRRMQAQLDAIASQYEAGRNAGGRSCSARVGLGTPPRRSIPMSPYLAGGIEAVLASGAAVVVSELAASRRSDADAYITNQTGDPSISRSWAEQMAPGAGNIEDPGERRRYVEQYGNGNNVRIMTDLYGQDWYGSPYSSTSEAEIAARTRMGIGERILRIITLDTAAETDYFSPDPR